MTGNITKIIQNYPNRFPGVFSLPFSAEIKRKSHWRLLGPPGMNVPGPVRGHGGGSRCRCCPAADFSAQRHSAGAWASCFGLAFFGSLWCKVRTAPLGQEKGEQRHCRLAVAPGRGRCPQGQDLLLPPISAQWVKSLLPYAWHHLFPCLPSCKPGEQICWQQNLMATFFTCAKFSLGAVFLGHPRQRGVAPAESTGRCCQPSLA